MFTFRRLTLLFFIILASLNLWNIFNNNSASGFMHAHAAPLYGGLFLLYFGISLAMAFLPCSNFHHPVVCRGRTDEKSVSITFDDGPDNMKTPMVLEVLKKHDVQAAFFCIGKKLAGNAGLLKKIMNEGHLIGNHSYSHSVWFDLFPARKMRAELLETDRLIKTITGKAPLFFRPPFGVVNPMVGKAAKRMDLRLICWDIRSLDTMNSSPQKIKHRILSQLRPGSIILLHDHTPFTEHHLDDLIVAIREAGYGIVPLDKLLQIPAYAS